MSTTNAANHPAPAVRQVAPPVAKSDRTRSPRGAALTAGSFAECLRPKGLATTRKHAENAHSAALPLGPRSSHPPQTQAAPVARQPLASRSDDVTTPKAAGPGARPDDGDRSLLTPFVPPPSVLAVPLAATPVSAPPGSSLARAEAAALAERLVRSMRVGKVGRDGHEVRLRLDVGARADVEVRLRHVDGALTATLVTDGASHADAERLAATLRQELADRGIDCDDVDVRIS